MMRCTQETPPCLKSAKFWTCVKAAVTLLGRGFFPPLKRRKRKLCTDLLDIISRMRERRLKFYQRIRVDGS